MNARRYADGVISRADIRSLVLLLACILLNISAHASPFTVNGRAPRLAIIVRAATPAPTWLPDAPMLRDRMGIVAVLEGRGIAALDATVKQPDPNAPPRGTLTTPIPDFIPLTNPTTTHTIYLYSTPTPTPKPTTLTIERFNKDRCFIRSGEDSKQLTDLDADRWTALTHLPASSLDPRPDSGPALDPVLFPPGQVIPLAPPYTPSPWSMDRDGLGDRLNARHPTTIAPADRDLATEEFFLRAPSTPDPAPTNPLPRGLLLWVSATPDGHPPQSLFQAADTLNLVIVSPANCGNDRDVSNRLQVTLDAVATALDRIPIDPSRIYATGISGGGRISSMLHICFPDLFTGSVPIVGINYYEKLPTGDGKLWPQSMVKPSASRFKLLRTQRIAAISGPPDFNFAQTQITVDRLKLDGLDARFFNYDDQAHHMPTPERFTDAMAWVDEASTARRDEAALEATSLVDSVEKSRGSSTAQRLTPPMRTRLDRACTIAPWSVASERAAAILERDDNPRPALKPSNSLDESTQPE